MTNVPTRGSMAAVIAVAASLPVGMGTAHALTAPPPPPAVRVVVTPAPPAADGTTGTRVPAMPRSFRLSLHEEYQSTNYYCVPATTAMSLATFGVKVSQALLARRMRTTTRGTGGDSAASVMDSYIHPRRFDDRLVADVVGHPEILMQRVSYDVGSLRRAPVIQVWMEKLPWNQGKLTDRWIGHAIIAYGYDQQAGTITVFDPWRPTGGPHTLSAKSLSMTLQSGAGMHYISKF
ncbi:MAG: C39 family peptidase [Actinoallomurus sp.]